MNTARELPIRPIKAARAPLPPGPKGHPILGVMPEFNRDTLHFITRCRDYGDVVRARFLYVTAYFLYHPSDIEYVVFFYNNTSTTDIYTRSQHYARPISAGA